MRHRSTQRYVGVDVVPKALGDSYKECYTFSSIE